MGRMAKRQHFNGEQGLPAEQSNRDEYFAVLDDVAFRAASPVVPKPCIAVIVT